MTKGSQIKVSVKCDYCGKIIKVVYRDYVNYKFDKYSCQKCRQKKTSEYNLFIRQEALYSRALKFCNDKGYELLTKKSDILNSATRVEYKCPKHGIHNTKIYTLICEHGCIDCSFEQNGIASRKDINDIYDDFAKYGGVLLNKEEYTEWNKKNLKVICRNCGEIFITSYCAFVLRGGQLCPKCSSNISKGEHRIKEFLEKHSVLFDMQYRFDDCKTRVPLPFDFYLPNYNMCIEYDGEGHYISIKRGKMSHEEAEIILNNIKYRDNIKTCYCNKNNIDLIRIPYWEFDNIEKILNNKLSFT